VVAVERKGRGISRFYGIVVDTASRVNIKSFIGEYIDQEAEIRKDKWTGYKGLNTMFPNLKNRET